MTVAVVGKQKKSLKKLYGGINKDNIKVVITITIITTIILITVIIIPTMIIVIIIIRILI